MFSYTTELLEIQAGDPKVHVLFIPGNPGFCGFIVWDMFSVRYLIV